MRRRTFLHRGTVLSIGLLAACTAPPTAAPTSAPAAPAIVAPKPGGVALGQLPTYVALQGPTPDLPGTPDGLVAPGYTNYPKDKLFQSVKEAPGRGGDISVSLETSNPPVPSVDQNPSWQA